MHVLIVFMAQSCRLFRLQWLRISERHTEFLPSRRLNTGTLVCFHNLHKTLGPSFYEYMEEAICMLMMMIYVVPIGYQTLSRFA